MKDKLLLPVQDLSNSETNVDLINSSRLKDNDSRKESSNVTGSSKCYNDDSFSGLSAKSTSLKLEKADVKSSSVHLKHTKIDDRHRGDSHITDIDNLSKMNNILINPIGDGLLMKKLNPTNNTFKMTGNRVRFYSMVEAMYDNGLIYREPLNIEFSDVHMLRRNTIAFSCSVKDVVNNFELKHNNNFENDEDTAASSFRYKNAEKIPYLSIGSVRNLTKCFDSRENESKTDVKSTSINKGKNYQLLETFDKINFLSKY